MKAYKKALIATFVLSSMALVACSGNPSTSQQPSASSASQAPSTVQSNTSQEAEKFKVKVNANYEGAPAPTEFEVEAFSFIEAPAAPTREGYTFLGWYTDLLGAHMWNFDFPVFQDLELKAFWLDNSKNQKLYTFEAELCPNITDGDGINGASYSGEAFGQGLIQEDRPGIDAKASNGFWVHLLYKQGNTLQFDIESLEDDTEAIFMVRLSMEYKNNVTFDGENYLFELNGENISYEDITFVGVPEGTGVNYLQFTDYIINVKIHLKQGTNTFKLITNNHDLLRGTASATAPMVDCLKIYTSSTLTWPTAKEANLIFVDE